MEKSLTMTYQRSSHLLHDRTSPASPPPATDKTSPADIALQLRRMKRRLFLELVNGGGSGGDENNCSFNNDILGGRSMDTSFRPHYRRCPSNASVGSSTKLMASRSRLSRTDSDVSGLFFSDRSLDSSIVSDENGEI